MSCECSEIMQRELRLKRSEARAHGDALKRNLDAFQEGIRQGADALACVHIHRAGVYLASKETHSVEPSASEIMEALENEISTNHRELLRYFSQHRDGILKEDLNADKRKMLRGILRQKSKAVGLLTGRATIELENARRALERAKRTEERLAAWKEGIKSSVTPELVQIADIHGHGFINQTNA